MEHLNKVLFFLPCNLGGAERMTTVFARMLDRSRYEVVFALIGKKPGAARAMIPEGCRTTYYHTPFVWVFSRIAVARAIRKERPDAVFCSLQYLSARVIPEAARRGIPSIIRNDSSLSYFKGFTRKLVCSAYSKASVLVSQQEEMAEELLALNGNVCTLHNPLDVEKITTGLQGAVSPYAEGTHNFVCVASLQPTKGQDLLVPAFVSAFKDKPDVHLYLVGGCFRAEYLKEIEGLASRSGISDRIHLVGFQANPYPWMKYADCLVLSSRLEGLPNVVLEAQYLGKVVVATRCIPAISRMVVEGDNGCLAEVDDVEGLSAALSRSTGLKSGRMIMTPSDAKAINDLFDKVVPKRA